MNSGSSALISSAGQSALCVATPLARINVAAFHVRHSGAGVLQHDDGIDAGALGERLVDIGLRGHPLRRRAGLSSAVMTRRLSQSVMRPASASGEKPAKTIEWIAPMLAQASMATAASGPSAGRWSTREPRWTPRDFRRLAKRQTVRVEFAVGDAAVDVFGPVGLPQDGDLVAARRKVAIEAIGGEVERAVLEPADAEIRLVEAGGADLGEGPDPVAGRSASPRQSVSGIGERLRVHRLIAGLVDPGAPGPILGDRIGGLAHRGRPLRKRCVSAAIRRIGWGPAEPRIRPLRSALRLPPPPRDELGEEQGVDGAPAMAVRNIRSDGGAVLMFWASCASTAAEGIVGSGEGKLDIGFGHRGAEEHVVPGVDVDAAHQHRLAPGEADAVVGVIVEQDLRHLQRARLAQGEAVFGGKRIEASAP